MDLRAHSSNKAAEYPTLAEFLQLLQGGTSMNFLRCRSVLEAALSRLRVLLLCKVGAIVLSNFVWGLSCAKIDSWRSLGLEGNTFVGMQIMSGELVGGNRATEQGSGGRGRRRGGRGRGHGDAAAVVAPAQQGGSASGGASGSRGQQGQGGSNGRVKQLLWSFQKQFREDRSSFQQRLTEQMTDERRSREQQQQQICDLLIQQQEMMADERRSREQQQQQMRDLLGQQQEQMAEERRSREQQQQQICDLLGQQQEQMAEERRSRDSHP